MECQGKCVDDDAARGMVAKSILGHGLLHVLFPPFGLSRHMAVAEHDALPVATSRTQ